MVEEYVSKSLHIKFRLVLFQTSSVTISILLKAILLYVELTDKVVVHDPDYRTALQDFTTFLEKLSEKVSESDETIPELPVKDLVSS